MILKEIKNGALKELFTISGSGKQVRDVMHAEDMKDLYFAGVEHINEVKGKAFNIGGGIENSLSLLELFDFLEKELDVKKAYTKLPWRKSGQKVFVANTSKANDLIQWVPDMNKFSGIRKLLDWMSMQLPVKRGII
jgi:CDP-paratose 2-epimerase